MAKKHDMVGLSMAMVGGGSWFSKSQMVSPISKFSRPITAQMSPLSTAETLARPMPSQGLELLDFRFLEGAVAVGNGDIHAFAHRAAVHTPDGDAAGVVVNSRVR